MGDRASTIISILLFVCAYHGVWDNSKRLLCMFSLCNVILVLKSLIILAVLVGMFYGAMLVGFDRCQLSPTLPECVNENKEASMAALGALLVLCIMSLCMGCSCICRLWVAYQGLALYRFLDRDLHISLSSRQYSSDDLEQSMMMQETPG